MVCGLIELDLGQAFTMHLIGCCGLPDVVQLCVDVKVASRRCCPSRQLKGLRTFGFAAMSHVKCIFVQP
jgi:hypothetical protein